MSQTKPNFYSQHGEDILLSEVFSDQETGFYVEIGGHDGRHLSNTLHFELCGWTGIAIEAHPDLFKQLEANRPNTKCIHAAIGNYGDTTIFYMSDIGSLSTFDKEQRDYFIRTRAEVTKDNYTEVAIQPMGTAELFQQGNAPEVIDFVSIDIEGAELDALETHDFEKYDVRIFILETDENLSEKEKVISRLLESHGYRLARTVSINAFWVKDPELFEKVAQLPFKGTLDRQYARGATDPYVQIKVGKGQNKQHRSVMMRLRKSLKKRWNRLFG